MQVNDNTPTVWRTTLAVQGFDLETDRQTSVFVGLVDTADGGVQAALRVGDDQRVILPLQDANQFAQNLNETTAERLKITGDRLGMVSRDPRRWPRGGLLHLLAPWRRGDQIVAGLAAFPPSPPVPKTLVGDRCGEDGCTSLIVAVSGYQLAQRIADHRNRCHG